MRGRDSFDYGPDRTSWNGMKRLAASPEGMMPAIGPRACFKDSPGLQKECDVLKRALPAHCESGAPASTSLMVTLRAPRQV